AAEEDIFGCRRKFPAVDALDGVDESLLRVGQYLRAVGPGREQWRHALGPAERDIRGFAERPVAAGVRLEALLGTDSVDRQLQRPRLARRRRQLVVDQTQRAVLEEINPIRDTLQRDAPRAVRASEFELTLQSIFEEPLADRR